MNLKMAELGSLPGYEKTFLDMLHSRETHRIAFAKDFA